LYQKWGPLLPSEARRITCPKPSDEIIKTVKSDRTAKKKSKKRVEKNKGVEKSKEAEKSGNEVEVV